MKYSARILTFVLCLLMVFPLLIIGAGAQTAGSGETSHRAQMIIDMTKIWDVYSQKTAENAPNAGSDTATVIFDDYIKQLYNLNDTVNDSTVDLIYAKGKAVAPLAWIYYSHPEVHPADGETTNEVYETYLAQKAVIDGKTTTADKLSEDTALIAFFNGTTDKNPEVYACYTELLRTVYTEKLEQVQSSEASSAVHRILTLSGATVLKLSYTDEDGTNFEEEYNYACNIVQKRKNWETTNEDVKKIFTLLYPSADFNSSSLLNNYFNRMEVLTPAYSRTESDTSAPTTSTVTEYNQSLNALLESTATDLLNGLKDSSNDSFRNVYLSAMVTTVENAVIRADAAGTLLEIVPLFDTYSYEWIKANAKDEITAYVDALIKGNESFYSAKDAETLNKIAKEYTDKNGILDGYAYSEGGVPTDPDQFGASIAQEVARAKKRADWFDYYANTLANIKGYVANDTELSAAAASQYAATDQAIVNGERDEMDAINGDQAILDDLVAEAEALAFVNKYRALLEKILTDVTVANDKATLDAAIVDAVNLSDAAAAKLADELTDIGSKYKEMIKQEVAAKLHGTDNETIRQDSIRRLNDRIAALPVTDTADKLSALPASAEALISKAKDVDAVLDHFNNSIANDTQYASYDDTYKAQMLQSCSNAAVGIIDETESAANAIVNLNRLEALAKLYAAAKGAESVTGIPEILTKAEAELHALSDADEIAAYTDDGVLRIQSYRAAQEDYQNTIDAIETLTNLSATQKANEKTSAKNQYDAFLSDIAAAHTAAEINAAQNELKNGLQALRAEAVATDLAIAKELAKNELTEKSNAASDTVGGYEFIDEESKQGILNQIEQNKIDASSAIDGCTDTAQVAQKKEEALNELANQKNLAAEEDRKDCLTAVTEALDNSYNKDDYSAGRQVEIHDILTEYETALQNASSVADYIALRDEALGKIRQIPNLLQEAQASSEARLRAAYEALLLRADLYSDANLLALREIYEHSLAELRQFSSVSDTANATALADERIDLMRAIPLDRVYTEDKLLANTETLGSPSDTYQPTVDGYIGAVEAPSGIASDAKLTITAANYTDVANRIRSAAKKELVRGVDGTVVNKAVLKLLKNCHVSAALDIDLGTSLLSSADRYTVSVLLPDGIRMSDVIGVVYLCEDGSVEFYEITSEDTLIRFVTTHFSEYYVVSENTVNLISWIVVLSILALCEIIVIVLLYLRKSRRNQEHALDTPLYSLALPIFTLTRYTPENGVLIVTLLGIAVVLLGAWIAVLILSDRRANLSYTEEEYPEEEPDELTLAAVPVPAMVSESEPEPDPEPMEETPLPDPVMEELSVEDLGFIDPEQYRGKHRAVINVDTLSEHFASGDTVTLNTLKETGLLPTGTGFVKILGRGQLDKALTVIAQDFSESAWKQIAKAGGTPTVTIASSELGGKKKPMPYRAIK
ncbi:MAG: uL15 family ribosomal protein [Clostridia bacterium]|nr:uL15 family ribosomal protein [Clostridia bacterium]